MTFRQLLLPSSGRLIFASRCQCDKLFVAATSTGEQKLQQRLPKHQQIIKYNGCNLMNFYNNRLY